MALLFYKRFYHSESLFMFRHYFPVSTGASPFQVVAKVIILHMDGDVIAGSGDALHIVLV